MKAFSYKIILYTLLLCCSSALKAQAIQPDSIYVGKRGNIFWDRTISFANLGNTQFTSYYKIYYRFSQTEKWQRSGILGQKIEPFLIAKNGKVSEEFKKYKKLKKQSFYLLGSAVVSCMGWMTYTAYQLANTGNINIYFLPSSLVLLGGFEVCFFIGRKKNSKADLHLFQSCYIYNRRY